MDAGSLTSSSNSILVLYVLQRGTRWFIQDRRVTRMEMLDNVLTRTIVAFMKLSRADFEHLLSLLAPCIRMQEACMRDGIMPKEKLIITLQFLATGNSYESLEKRYRIPQQYIASFIPQVCGYLIMFLRGFVKLPSTSYEWLKVSKEFAQKFGYPHAIGAIGGKHVAIKIPTNNNSAKLGNHKQFSSIVVFAVVDANANFIYAEIRGKGRLPLPTVFRNTHLYTSLQKKQLNVPKAGVLRNTSTLPIPYMLLGDKSFEFKKFCIRPFAGRPKTGSVEYAYNVRHSKARKPFELAFGILTNRFRVLKKTIESKPEIARKIVMASIYLHNFIRRNRAERCDGINFVCPLSDLFETSDYATDKMKNVRLHLANEFVNGTL